MNLILGDCLDKLKELEDNSIDSIVTDPPYGLAFMGKKWDYDVPSQAIWEECMRILKSGGHLLAFAGSRTYHRMAVRIEDAGFEIRDQIMWVYGSGFPKSHNIGKAVDKIQGNEREVLETTNSRDRTKHNANTIFTGQDVKGWTDSKGNSPYEGWGTALKPAHEPIVMARKPFKGTVVDNVLEWGTGGINIDGCRIATDETLSIGSGKVGCARNMDGSNKGEQHIAGRFPANIIFDEDAGKILDEQSGTRKGFSGGGGPTRFGGATGGEKLETYNYHNDTGGASRFFYCPKASKNDRNEGLDSFEKKLQSNANFRPNHLQAAKNGDSGKPHGRYTPTQNNHPTVKPTDLMLYLIRLVTPKGGITLDPFMGSGSTGKAAVRGGFEFVGIEREKDYFQIAEARIQYEIDNPYIEGKDKRI